MPIALLFVIDAMGITTLEYLLGRFHGEVHFPNLSRLGLGSILKDSYGSRFNRSTCRRGTNAILLNQASTSADSLIGHREMMGIIDNRTFKLFPSGFPLAYILELEKRIGRKTMFNRMGGGLEVIEANAEAHRVAGHPIVYASKCDPLIQIAMDEDVIPIAEQHAIVDTALALALEMGIPITRSIARPYIRRDGEYVRTANRHDAVLPLPSGTRTLVDILRERGVRTVSVGKPSDLIPSPFDREIHLADPRELDPQLGLRFVHPKRKDTNPYTTQGVLNALSEARSSTGQEKGTFIFANWVDTDSLYGHARDVEGALHALEEIDRVIPLFEANLRPGDLIIITADHGMEHRSDYGYHSREPVPLLVEHIGGENVLRKSLPGKGLTRIGELVAKKFSCNNEFRRSITILS